MTEHFNNGKLKLEGEYENRKKIGIWFEYNENGSLKNEYEYIKGKRYLKG